MLHGLKTPTIYSIFEKVEGGAYTRLALLYQDILKYYVHLDHHQQENDGSFKDRELANWLLNHNHHWINHYKDPSTWKTKNDSRVDFIAENIKDKIIHLIKLAVLLVRKKEDLTYLFIDIHEMAACWRGLQKA